MLHVPGCDAPRELYLLGLCARPGRRRHGAPHRAVPRFDLSAGRQADDRLGRGRDELDDAARLAPLLFADGEEVLEAVFGGRACVGRRIEDVDVRKRDVAVGRAAGGRVGVWGGVFLLGGREGFEAA